MEAKLDGLIEKLKQDGIEQGKQQAEEIIREAKQKAEQIITDAKKEAEKLIADGEKQANQFRFNAEADIAQAARNAELLVKENIMKMFDSIFKNEVKGQLKDEFLASLIQKLVTEWVKGKDVEIIVSEEDKKNLEKLLFKGLKKEMRNTITLRVSPQVTSGFRIGIKDESVFYDFTDEAIADVLKMLINPKLKQLLDRKDG